jgi:DNA replication protein DnaC
MIEFDSVNMETEREKVKRQRLAELDKIMEGGIEPKKSEKQPAIPRVSSFEQESPEFESSEPKQIGSSSLLDMIYNYVGYDVLEIFGDTGTGKTAFVKKVAHDAAEAGKNVFYLDTERNLTKKILSFLKNAHINIRL